MAQIFRVERTKNFTVMSNHHFKNKKLKSIASEEQRRFEEQKRLEEQERARAA